jgi:hypothetical protein
MSRLADALRLPFLRRFGGKAAVDRARLRAWLQQIGEFNPTYARILQAFKDGNVDRARAEVDQLIAAVNLARERLPSFDSADLQTATQDYAAALLALARAADRVLSLDEGAARDGTAVERSDADEALAEFRRRGVEARAASQALIARLTANLTPRQREHVEALSRRQGGSE